MSEKTETESEMYQEILAAVKAKDKKIETLEQDIKTLKEMNQKNEEAKTSEDDIFVGYCDECRHPLTAAEARNNDTCPYCHTGRTLSSP